jgi:SET domain
MSTKKNHNHRPRNQSRKIRNDSDYIHKSLYQAKGKNGIGTFSRTNIPKNTVIIRETPVMLHDTPFNTEYIYKLIKYLLESEHKAKFLDLVPHSLEGENTQQYTENKEYHKKYLPMLSKDEMKLYYIKMLRNMFGYGGSGCILFYATKLNHSCNPHVVFYKEGNKMFFKTIRPIKAGEEVFDRYINTNNTDKKTRQYKLLKSYGFLCDCEKCKAEGDP